MQQLSRPQRMMRGGVQRAAPARLLSVRVQNANCMIVNTKGGGHAFIGLYLAKALLKKGHQVTIMNDGDRVSESGVGGSAPLPAASSSSLQRSPAAACCTLAG